MCQNNFEKKKTFFCMLRFKRVVVFIETLSVNVLYYKTQSVLITVTDYFRASLDIDF